VEDEEGEGLIGITAQIYDDCVSLVYIVASNECASQLPHAAQRIRRNIRRTDTVLLLGNTCAIILPATPLQGAQAVARRVATLLVDVDCELQAFYGLSALTVWQRLQSEQAIEVSADVGTRRGEPFESQPANQPDGLCPTCGQAGCKERIVSHAGAGTSNAPDLPSLPLLSPQRAQSVPYLAYLADYPSRRLLHLFPYELACLYQCVPVGAERDMLTIGISQYLDDAVIAHFEQVTRRGIFQVRCEARLIEDVLRYWQQVTVENADHSGETLTEPEGVRQLI
jgi:hypothetical protein